MENLGPCCVHVQALPTVNLSDNMLFHERKIYFPQSGKGNSGARVFFTLGLQHGPPPCVAMYERENVSPTKRNCLSTGRLIGWFLKGQNVKVCRSKKKKHNI